MSKAMIRKATFEVRGLGLHARPAAMVVKCVKDLACKVTFHKGSRAFDVGGRQVVVPSDEQADGKSIMSMMTLGCERGCVIQVICEGPDAQRAMDALRQLPNDEAYDYEGGGSDGFMFAAVE